MRKKTYVKGIVLALLAGILWGITGPLGQYLFDEKTITPEWLVTCRLIASGSVILLGLFLKRRLEIFTIWKDKKDALHMIIYSVAGMMAVQYSFFIAVEASNGGTATVLQYTAPVMIMVYLSIRNRKLPEVSERVALILAFGGIILLATHGHLTELSISKTTLVLGLMSAVATVFYNLLPGNLMDEYSTFAIVGWGMLVSGIGLLPFVRPWNTTPLITWDWQTFLCTGVVIIVGTVLSFGCYMEGVRLIGGSRASLFASVEPLTATIASVLFMGVAFSVMDLLGFVGIIGAVVILSLPRKGKE